MNKDENMAKAIRKAMVEYVGEKYYELCVAGFSADIISKALYNANYRKIPEGSVVISKEEYEILTNISSLKDKVQEALNINPIEELVQVERDARQETAREILQEILYTKSSEEWFENEQLVDFGKKIVDKIENLANKYGIELEDVWEIEL